MKYNTFHLAVKKGLLNKINTGEVSMQTEKARDIM